MGSISLAEANAKCPGLIVLPMRVERYRQAGAAVLEVLNAWGAPVEKTSYDVVRNAVHVGDAEGFFAQHSQGLPMSARIWQGCEEDVSPDLEAGVRLAEEMRRAIRCKLGLTASVGVARSKIAARMMSPLAKPDGILLVTDTEADAFMLSRPIRSLPGFQQQRGKEVCTKLARLLSSRGAAINLASDVASHADDHVASHLEAPSVDVLTVGDAAQLSAAVLVRCVGEDNAARLRRAAAGEDSVADVRVRGLPRTLSTEASFPPMDDLAAIAEQLRALASSLVKRLVAESAARQRAPVRLLLSYRRGYASSTSGGVVRSHGLAWPPRLATALLRHEASAFATVAPDAQGAAQSERRNRIPAREEGIVSADLKPAEVHGRDGPRAASAVDICSLSEELAAVAVPSLLSRLAAPPQLTRLIVSADFGTAASQPVSASIKDFLVEGTTSHRSPSGGQEAEDKSAVLTTSIQPKLTRSPGIPVAPAPKKRSIREFLSKGGPGAEQGTKKTGRYASQGGKPASLDSASLRVRSSVQDADLASSTDDYSWSCERCTYLHDTADARHFLVCSMCSCPRR
uniref:UmuC domain-containing protein n=1 Tax=Chrysotila carterae TaxID=13221 RepID=A0A7S4B1M2_CHRCT